MVNDSKELRELILGDNTLSEEELQVIWETYYKKVFLTGDLGNYIEFMISGEEVKNRLKYKGLMCEDNFKGARKEQVRGVNGWLLIDTIGCDKGDNTLNNTIELYQLYVELNGREKYVNVEDLRLKDVNKLSKLKQYKISEAYPEYKRLKRDVYEEDLFVKVGDYLALKNKEGDKEHVYNNYKKFITNDLSLHLRIIENENKIKQEAIRQEKSIIKGERLLHTGYVKGQISYIKGLKTHDLSKEEVNILKEMIFENKNADQQQELWELVVTLEMWTEDGSLFQNLDDIKAQIPKLKYKGFITDNQGAKDHNRYLMGEYLDKGHLYTVNEAYEAYKHFVKETFYVEDFKGLAHHIKGDKLLKDESLRIPSMIIGDEGNDKISKGYQEARAKNYVELSVGLTSKKGWSKDELKAMSKSAMELYMFQKIIKQ